MKKTLKLCRECNVKDECTEVCQDAKDYKETIVRGAKQTFNSPDYLKNTFPFDRMNGGLSGFK